MIATVEAVRPLGRAHLLEVTLPAGRDAGALAGRFVMARACDGGPLDRVWDPYLRVPLFAVDARLQGASAFWTLYLPPGGDAASRWLAARRPGAAVDLLGPAGQGFTFEPRLRARLLAADLARAPFLFSLIHPMLDAGGRVVVLLRLPAAEQEAPFAADLLLRSLPLAAEVRAEPAASFAEALGELGRWADHVALALGGSDVADWGAARRALHTGRLRLDAGFAQALWPGPLPCGIGACLACLAPTAGGGFTRACVHGPVFDLTTLAPP